MLDVFLDDLRKAPEEYNKVFRTGEDMVDWFRDNQPIHIDKLSLDHDLGPEGMMNGYDVVKELCDMEITYGKVQFHTDNLQGLENMYYYLKNAMKHGVVQVEELIPNKVECIDGVEKLVAWHRVER